MLAEVELGDASRFTTYDETTNTLRVQDLTLSDAGDYRILVLAKKDQDDQDPLMKYLNIIITDQERYDQIEPSFRSDLPPVNFIVDEESEIDLPILDDESSAIKEVVIEAARQYVGLIKYVEEGNKIIYEPPETTSQAQLQNLTGKSTTLVKLVVEVDSIEQEYVYEMETIFILRDPLLLLGSAVTNDDSEEEAEIAMGIIFPLVLLILLALLLYYLYLFYSNRLRKEYIVGKELGKDQSGQVSVREVTRIKDERKFALKQFRIADKNDESLLWKEIEILKAIDHINFVKFEDAFTIKTYFGFKSDLCIILELCEGGNLFDWVQKKKKLNQNISEEKVLQIATDLL